MFCTFITIQYLKVTLKRTMYYMLLRKVIFIDVKKIMTTVHFAHIC